MHFSSRDFYSAMQTLLAKGILRDQAVSMAFGAAIADQFCVEQKLSIPRAFFSGECGERVFNYINAMNNIVPVDIECIRKYASDFFQLNHYMCHGVEHLPCSDNAIYDKLGYTSVFTKEEICLIAQQGGAFQEVYAWAGNMLKTYVD